MDPYLKDIQAALVAGNATEHTYRPALKHFLESLTPGITATNEPKRVACGAPDFIVTKGQAPLGYVEAKDVNVDLSRTESTPQLKRYLESLSNLVLTDYLEFRWYVGGEHRLTARAATVASNGKLRLSPSGPEDVKQLLSAFLTAQAPTVNRPRDLAERMAALARLICEVISNAFAQEDTSGSLHQQMDGFRKVLIHELSPAQFADMYAQSIAYGLFAARVNAPNAQGFTREQAAYDLPKTNPFLRKMFTYLAGPDLDSRIEWAVDDMADTKASRYRSDPERLWKENQAGRSCRAFL